MPAKLSSNEEYALQQVAKALGVKRDSLYNLINFESGWNPKAKNPSSGARGLIQFMPTTASNMGFTKGIFASAADTLVEAHPSRVAQLKGPVLQYLKALGPYSGTDQDLFMSVFYPAYRRVAPTTLFPGNVIAQNPGVYTPMDYVNKVYKAAGIKGVVTSAGGGGLVLVALAVGAYLLLKKKR